MSSDNNSENPYSVQDLKDKNDREIAAFNAQKGINREAIRPNKYHTFSYDGESKGGNSLLTENADPLKELQNQNKLHKDGRD